MSLRFKGLGLFLPLGLAGVAAVANATDVTDTVPATALKACAAIGAAPERLACYDRLAAGPSATPAPAAAPVTAASPAIVAPARAPSKESFGLYAAEHPAAPAPTASLTATVLGLGVSATGYPTVALDGGQVWELDGADPFLAGGDSVTIKRAAFGSFILTTSRGRTHRVHRLR